MATLKDEAKAYKPQQTKNIADLEVVDINLPIQDREGLDLEGKTFKYKVLIKGDEEYRVPASVLKDIQTIVQAKPNLTTIKVVKKGQGMNTSYTVIPLN